MFNLKFIVPIVIFFSLTACSLKATGPAEDPFDLEDKEPKLDLGSINILKSKTKKENEELRKRLERLENAQRTGVTPTYQANSSSDITSPPIGGGNRTPTLQAPRAAINPNDTASFEEWKLARSKGSDNYKEFKEYQEWLEFKKLKQQGK